MCSIVDQDIRQMSSFLTVPSLFTSFKSLTKYMYPSILSFDVLWLQLYTINPYTWSCDVLCHIYNKIYTYCVYMHKTVLLLA